MASEAHGGLDLVELRRLGANPGSIVDFSTNVNPLGPSPYVVEALRGVDIASYPDPTSLELRERLAWLNGVSRQEVLVGNGTAELIWLLCRALIKPGASVVIAGPTFGEYQRAAEACGAEVIEVRAAPPDFQHEPDRWRAAIEEHNPALFFLCSPNNPTGWQLTEGEIAALAGAMSSGYLVLDEAYRGFTEAGPFGRRPHQKVVALRSMTKDFGLAGLRLGYLLTSSLMVKRVSEQQPPWSVGSAAQAAGLAALDDLEHLEQSIAQLNQWADSLKADLIEMGAAVAPTQMHYFLVQVADAFNARRKLLGSGCLVRDATSFGLAQRIRIGTRTPPENQRLLRAWQDIWADEAREAAISEEINASQE